MVDINFLDFYPKEIVSKFEAIERIINEYDKFLITTHIKPDGDAIGSEVAFCKFVESYGKDVLVLNEHITPIPYRFLDPEYKVKSFLELENLPEDIYDRFVFVLDTNDMKMIGDNMNSIIEKGKMEVYIIDHHIPKDLTMKDRFLIYPEASSTCEIVYSIIRYNEGLFDEVMAKAIYTGIITDTKSFRYNRTNPLTHLIASHLLEFSLDTDWIHQTVFENISHRKLLLISKAMSSLKLIDDGKIAYQVITLQDMINTKAHPEETEGIIDFPFLCGDVEVSILFVEEAKNKIKVSLRSKGDFNVGEIAMEFGGGGHRNASGARIKDSLERVIKMVLDSVMLKRKALIAENKF